MRFFQAKRQAKFPVGARDQLHKSAAEGRLFALIDPTSKVPVEVETAPLQFRDTDPIFFEMIAWDKVRFRSPMLVQVDAKNFTALAESLPLERWGFFVVSNFDLWTLAAHFQKFVIAKGPDKNPYFLRFHDPSVIEVLLRTWSEAERRAFLGPIETIGVPNLANLDLQIWNTPSTINSKLPAPEDCLLSLTESQLLECAEAIERDLVKIVYWHLRGSHAKSVQFLSTETLQSRISYALDRARRYNLVSVSDMVGYVSLMFEVAPNFDEHPSVRQALEDPTAPPLAKMQYLSSQIPESVWQEVVLNFDRNFWK